MTEARERLSPPEYLDPGGLLRTLVEATGRALRGEDCADLAPAIDDAPLGRPAISLEQAHEIDAEAVADWVVDQYRHSSYRGAVIGSRHGAAAHLAVALGMPWLPSGFSTDIRWPGGCAADLMSAMSYGMAAGHSVLGVNRGVLVRQVHNPTNPGAGRQVNLHLRWRALPEAYQEFLARHLDPGGSVLMLRDVRPWPVLDLGGEFSFQLGSAVSGLDFDAYLAGPGTQWSPQEAYGEECGEHGVERAFEASTRQWTRDHGSSYCSVLYNGSATLSAVVADVYRDWLRCNGKTGNRLVVETGRLLDPRHIVRTGSVPYWCETGTRGAVEAAELWVAASDPFATIEVFPEAPAHSPAYVAAKDQWSGLANFATVRGVVDAGMARGYPHRRPATRLATRALRGNPYDLPEPAPLTAEAAIAGMRATASPGGLLVSFPGRD